MARRKLSVCEEPFSCQNKTTVYLIPTDKMTDNNQELPGNYAGSGCAEMSSHNLLSASMACVSYRL